MTTKHTCGGPVFGRRAPLGECRRCDELRFGLAPVRWSNADRKRQSQIRCDEIRKHDCTASRCGPVCTFGDW